MIWFNRKPKNRRLGREHVLDVKLRSNKLRAARVRLAVVSLSLVLGAGAGFYVIWFGGQWLMNQVLYENKAFAIEKLEVQTDGVISLEQLRRWAGVRLGENLLALDLGRVRRDLRMVSTVQSVSLERVLPHTLRIQVVEREPVAQVSVLRPAANGGIEKAIFFLDADGYVMVPLDPRQRAVPPNPAADQLPLICGLNPNEVQAGRKIDLPQVRAALDLVVAFERSPMESLAELKSIDVSAPEVLLVTTSQGSQVTFGLSDQDLQLRRWQAVFLHGQRNKQAIASLDLAVTNSIPVVFQDASALPPATPKPIKPYRRKHV